MIKNIQMVDLYGQYLNIKKEIDKAIEEVLDTAQFIKGPVVKDFERGLAEYLSVGNVISCGNGTDALQIAMMAFDFRPGDEVILPVFTYIATAEVVALLGLKPVFVDVNPLTFDIDADLIEKKITDKTVAIVPVHLFGQCADMENIMRVADKYDLKVIEDAAQAIGAEYISEKGNVNQSGTIGHIGITSFFPSKNLGCFGDGGALMTEADELAEKCRMIANHGQRKKYHHDLVGVNSRLDSLQAAILRVKLRKLDEYTAKRRKVAEFYNKHLAELKFLEIPYASKNSTHVYNQYTLKVSGMDRDEFKKYLLSHGIPSMIYYPIPLHYQNAYRSTSSVEQSYPVAEELCRTVISIPIHTELQEEVQQFIVDKIKSFIN